MAIRASLLVPEEAGEHRHLPGWRFAVRAVVQEFRVFGMFGRFVRLHARGILDKNKFNKVPPTPLLGFLAASVAIAESIARDVSLFRHRTVLRGCCLVP
jgi:hypothetical protein